MLIHYKKNGSSIFSKFSMFTTIIISISLLVFILFIITNIVSIFVRKDFVRKSLDSNSKYIEYVCENIDSQVRNVHNIMYKYISNLSVQLIGIDYTDRYFNINTLHRGIAWDAETINILDDIIIVYKNKDLVVNKEGSYSKDFYFKNMIIKNSTIDYVSDAKDHVILKQVSEVKFTLFKNSDKVLYYYYQDDSFKVNMLIDYYKFVQLATKPNYSDGNKVFIFDEDKSIILQTDKDFKELNVVFELLNSNIRQKYKYLIGDTKYIVNVKKSDTTQWQYVVLTPYYMIENDVKALSRYYLLFYIVFTLVGLFLLMYYKKAIILPLRLIVDNITPFSQKKSRNELITLNNSLNKIVEENTLIKYSMEKNRSLIRRKLIEDLLEKEIEIEESYLNQYFSEFIHEKYILLEVVYNDSCRINGGTLISEVMSTFSNEQLIYEVVSNKNGNILLMVNSSMSFNIIISEFRKRLYTCLYGKLNIACIVSCPIDRLNNLGFAYHQIEMIRDSRNINKRDCVFTVDDVLIQQVHMHKINEKELVHSIRSGKVKHVSRFLNDLSINNINISIKEAKEVITFFTRILEKNSREINIEIIQGLDDKIKSLKGKLIDKEEILNAERILFDELARLTVYIKERIDIENDDVIKFINNNFYCITLDMVADHFDMHRNYISAYVKKKIGESFKEYTSRLKIEYAKKLISENNKNISEIAQTLGFVNTSSFIRFFKRMEGCTPGDYSKY